MINTTKPYDKSFYDCESRQLTIWHSSRSTQSTTFSSLSQHLA